MRRLIVIFTLAMVLSALLVVPVGAQGGGNVLVNGDMEAGFAPATDFLGVPVGWRYFIINAGVNADRLTWQPHVHSGSTAWIFTGRYASNWIAGGYQRATVVPGQTYRLTAYVFQWTCNNLENSCIPGDGPRYSETESNAKVRIGVDPGGGEVATAPSVVYGAYAQPWDNYTALTLDVVAETEVMTVFLWGEGGGAMAFNDIYWDSVSLTPIGESANVANADGSVVVAPAAPVNNAPPAASANFAPFVNPQNARPDGSLIHRVQQDDTFNTIVFAYADLGVTQDQILERNGWRFVPDFIAIGEEIVILPPGSIDPQTGELLQNPSANNAAPPPQADPNAVPADDPVPANQGEAAPPPPANEASPVSTGTLRTVNRAELGTIPILEEIAPFAG